RQAAALGKLQIRGIIRAALVELGRIEDHAEDVIEPIDIGGDVETLLKVSQKLVTLLQAPTESVAQKPCRIREPRIGVTGTGCESNGLAADTFSGRGISEGGLIHGRLSLTFMGTRARVSGAGSRCAGSRRADKPAS